MLRGEQQPYGLLTDSFLRLQAQAPLRLLDRYGGILVRYGDTHKLANAARALLSWARERQTIDSEPVFLKVEICRQCHVRCRYCFAEKSDTSIPLHQFKEIVDSVKHSVLMVQLHEVGEPLLHDDLVECIRYAHKCGLGTVISTSLSVTKPESFWADLANSGLDHLIASIDGVTEDVYRTYRTQGNLELVLANLQKLIQYRAKTGSHIHVEWQMIDFPWNRHEQALARRLSRQYGCDAFRLLPDASQRTDYAKSAAVRQRNCIWPYLLLLVNAHGDVIPCFKPGCGPSTVGSLRQRPFSEIWNGTEIRRLRDRRLITDCQGCRTCRE